MACQIRQLSGQCMHNQCPYPEESGYDCVEIRCGCCECSGGCFDQCRFNRPVEETNKAFDRFYADNPFWRKLGG